VANPGEHVIDQPNLVIFLRMLHLYRVFGIARGQQEQGMNTQDSHVFEIVAQMRLQVIVVVNGKCHALQMKHDQSFECSRSDSRILVVREIQQDLFQLVVVRKELMVAVMKCQDAEAL